MSFLVRQISFKASGEEIVRPTTVEGDELVIGRDKDCGVHLPDLAVDPRHARVRRIDDGTLLVESLGEQPFQINGRSLTRIEFDFAAGAELRFGGHRITVGKDPQSGLPTLSVVRVEALSESSEDIDATKAYTLAGLLPGKRLSAWGFAVLVLLAFLVGPLWSYTSYKPLALHEKERRPAGFHADSMWSSGHLSQGHKNLENDCQACHVDAFVAVRDNACMTCHTDDAHQHIKDAGRLVKARGEPAGFAAFQRAVADAFNRPQGRCVECHTEHTGAGAMPATQQKFCTDCHDGLKSRLPDTRIADAADFGTAHPEFRPMIVMDPTGAKPVLTRATWSPTLRENGGLKFTHGQHLSTTNGVAQMVARRGDIYRGQQGLQCKDCHQVDQTGIRYKAVEMEQACQTCHSLSFDEVGGTVRTLRHGEPALVVADLRAFYRAGSPPRPASLGGMARRRPGNAPAMSTAADYARAVNFYPMRAEQAVAAVFSKGGMCYDCHVVMPGGTAQTGGFTIQRVAQNDRYYGTGWFSHKDHTKSDCAECHVKAKTSNEATDLLVPGLDGPGGCRTCHVGEGGAKLATAKVKDPVESGCAMCHSYHMDTSAPPWQPKKPKITTAVADRPRLPLFGNPSR